MGRAKLMLPIGESTVIARLLAALRRPEITETVVVVRSDDDAIINEVDRYGATTVVPESDPPDMRASVEHAVNEIRRIHTPSADDGWLLIPADHPIVIPDVLTTLVNAWHQSNPQILVPTCDSRRGHPTFFRWSFADMIRDIPENQGLNQLIRMQPDLVMEYAIDDDSVITDMDTPADYESILRRLTAVNDPSAL